MASRDQGNASAKTTGSIFWLWAGGLAVIALPWLQRWLYIFPELDHRLFWGSDFAQIVLSSSHPKTVVEISHIYADGLKLAERVSLKPMSQAFSQTLRTLDQAFFVSRAAVIEPGREYGEALVSMDPSAA